MSQIWRHLFRRHGWGSPLAAALALVFASVTSCVCTRSPSGDSPRTEGVAPDALRLARSFSLDRTQARRDLEVMTAKPHVFGSARQRQISEHLKKRLGQSGGKTYTQTFSTKVPNPEALDSSAPVPQTLKKTGRNIYGWPSGRGEPECVVAIGSHYDTTRTDGFRYVGANDSGSSTVTLLQQLAFLSQAQKKGTLPEEMDCGLVGVFFDGEEAFLKNWHDGTRKHPAGIVDHTYGSRHAVSQLRECRFRGEPSHCLPPRVAGGAPVIALVLMDMIGSPGIRLTWERYSTPSLRELAGEAATSLGHLNLFTNTATAVTDDHRPFLKRGIPALNLIDFEHLDYWHRPGDTLERVSFSSMDTAGRVALATALTVAQHPGKFE